MGACNALLENGASVCDQDEQGKGVFHIAAERNHFDLLQVREISTGIECALSVILYWQSRVCFMIAFDFSCSLRRLYGGITGLLQ